MEFDTWLKEKLQEWRRDKFGRDASTAAYARYLGVSRDVLNGWLAGHKPESKRYLDALIARYGNEVHEVLSIPSEPIDGIAGKSDDEIEEFIRRVAADRGWQVKIVRNDQ
jgi:hypothetical protein